MRESGVFKTLGLRRFEVGRAPPAITTQLCRPNPHQTRQHTRSTGMCLAHRVINWDGQYFTAVWTLDFSGAGDGSREAEFVGDEVVEEGH